jgi:hypothetical protein
MNDTNKRAAVGDGGSKAKPDESMLDKDTPPSAESRAPPRTLDELKRRRIWLCFKLIPKSDGSGKFDKVPHYAASGAKRSGKQGADADRAQRVTFDEAVAAAARHRLDGAAIAPLPGDGLVILDLDHITLSADDSGLKLEAVEWLRRVEHTYVERSPSGTGAHALFCGSSKDAKNNNTLVAADGSKMGVEIFSQQGFVTFTDDPIGCDGSAALAEWTPELEEFFRPLIQQKQPRGRPKKPRPIKFDPDSAHDRGQLAEALQRLDADDRDVWMRVCVACGRAFNQQPGEGFDIVNAWARGSAKYNERETRDFFFTESRKDRDPPLTVASIFGAALEKGWRPHDGRPRIELDPARIADALDAAAAALAATGALFQRGQSVVRILTALEAARQGIALSPRRDVKRDDAAPIVLPVTPAYLWTLLDRHLRFEKWDGRREDFITAAAPRDFAERLLAMVGDWPLPRLNTVTGSPFLRSDGSLCLTPGYDEATATMLFAAVAELPSVPERPSKDDALAALLTLLAPFEEVPFAEPHHKAVFIAYILTLIVRPILPVVPAFFFSSPIWRTGKGLTIDCATLIVQGIAPTRRTYTRDEAEQRKVLQALMMAGDAVILFDDCPTGTSIGSNVLNMYLTAERVGDRILGQSSAPPIVNSSTVAFTGVNIDARADFVLRALRVNIDPKTENPEARKFQIPDLLAYCAERRPQLLGAALTMLRAFIVARMPAPNRAPLGGFQHWDRLVSGCVVWLGMDDPINSQVEMKERDPIRTGDMEIMRTLFEAFRKNETDTRCDFRVAWVAERIKADAECALATMLAGKPFEGDVDRLNYWLRGHRDRICAGLLLFKANPDATSAQGLWGIERVPDDEGAPF